MKDTPHILLVNPWIHDFAAYDFWAKPIGLLYLASILRDHGFKVSYLDCLDRFHPQAPESDPCARHGRGPYIKSRIPKPPGLVGLPRHYSRYGIPEQWLRQDLRSVSTPDLALVTSLMTYWYPGVRETVNIIKAIYPDVPVLLGGIYATLCHRHALQHSGADSVTRGAGEQYLLELVGRFTGFTAAPKFDHQDPDSYPYPAFDLQHKINYVPLLTSRGCPFSCTYCAAHILNPGRMLRDPLSVVTEIAHWHERHGIDDFVFYDDALLVDAESHAIPLMEGILRTGLKVRFHTPNAIHIRGISKKTAGLMRQTGFTTIRLGLETAAFENRNALDGKVTAEEFRQAVDNLRKAGFRRSQIGAYLLVGLPGQTTEAIIGSIDIVKKSGGTPVLAYYSPIPQTKMWDRAVAASRYDLDADPVFTNNAILPCWSENFSWQTLSRLKQLAAA